MLRLFIFLIGFTFGSSVVGEEVSYRDSMQFSVNDYLLQYNGQTRDKVFDEYAVAELNAGLEWGASCGSIDVKGSLQSSFKNMVDSKYFEDLGQSVLNSAPLLMLCYYSPSACSLAKHFKINSSMLAQMRLDSCALTDKYVNSRIQDYEIEKQECVRKAIGKYGGDMEKAMSECGRSSQSYKLANWAGKANGEKVEVNKLIESSAKWAGFEGREAKRVVDMTKAFVGDSVLVKGDFKVEYGPQKRQVSPRLHHLAKKSKIKSELCGGVFEKIDMAGGGLSIDRVVTSDDLKAVNGDLERPIIDKETIRSLYAIPTRLRESACERLSSSVALAAMTFDVERSIDVLSVAANNPNLPKHRKSEIYEKRRALSESLDMTLKLERERNGSVNEVVTLINQTGSGYRGERLRRDFEVDTARSKARRVRKGIFDCSDNTLCRTEVN